MNIPEFVSKNQGGEKNMCFHVQELQPATKATKAAAIPAAIPATRADRKMNEA